MTTIDAKTILEKSADGRLDYKSEITTDIRNQMDDVINKPDSDFENKNVLIIEKLKALLEGVKALQEANKKIGEELEELEREQVNLEVGVIANRCDMIEEALEDCTKEEKFISETYNRLLDHEGYLVGLSNDVQQQGVNANDAENQAKDIEKVIEKIIANMNIKATEIDSKTQEVKEVENQDKLDEIEEPNAEEPKEEKEKYTTQKEGLNDKLGDIETANKNLENTKIKAETLKTTADLESKKQEVLLAITNKALEVGQNKTNVQAIVEKYVDDKEFDKAFNKLEESISNFKIAKEVKHLEFNSDLNADEKEALIHAKKILDDAKTCVDDAQAANETRTTAAQTFEETCTEIETLITNENAKVTEETLDKAKNYKTDLEEKLKNVTTQSEEIDTQAGMLNEHKNDMTKVGEIKQPENDEVDYDDKDRARLDAIKKLGDMKTELTEIEITKADDQEYIERQNNIDWEILNGKIESFESERKLRKELAKRVVKASTKFNTPLGHDLITDEKKIKKSLEAFEKEENAIPLNEFIGKDLNDIKFKRITKDNMDEVLNKVETSDTGLQIDFSKYDGVLNPSNPDEKKLIILFELDSYGQSLKQCQFSVEMLAIRKLRNGTMAPMSDLKNYLGDSHFIVKVISNNMAKFKNLKSI